MSGSQSSLPAGPSLSGAGARSLPSSSVRPRPWEIVVIYAVCAGLWIAFSDTALALLVQDPVWLLRLSLYKGFAFVALTALVLYFVIRRSFRMIESGVAQLRSQKREIERFNRLYLAFSRINHEVMTADEPDALFARICQVLVRQGRFRMAWIGLLDESGNTLQPVASAGSGVNAVLDDLTARAEVNAGSVGWDRVIKSAQAMVSNDFTQGDDTRHWIELAERHDLQSRAAFPLLECGRVIGVLSVYARESNFFRENEVSLLEEVVVDVSLALDRFALAEESREAESLAHRELSFSQAMIDSMPGIVYFYDDQGRFLRWNRSFETVSGYSSAEIAHLHPLDLFDANDRPLVGERIARALEEGEATVEADFCSRDGSRRPYFFTGRGLDYDGRRCLVGVGIDITERKRAENALREFNDTLEQRVADRTAELKTALERAEVADRLKSAFLATMSHELRTPLNSIIGFTGIILQGLAGPLNDEQGRQLGMVQGSARHLLELINDVLDLSKIEAGQLEVRAEPFDLRESLDRVVGSVVPLVEKKGLVLDVNLPSELPPMTSDRRRFEQVVLNLLNNAIKFTDVGRIGLSLELQENYTSPGGERGAAIRLAVRDTGIGIRQQDQANLFQPFQQVDSGLTRKHEGTGLGLMICRRLTELMGGEIRLRSEWGAGSEFTVLLPLDRSGQP